MSLNCRGMNLNLQFPLVKLRSKSREIDGEKKKRDTKDN